MTCPYCNTSFTVDPDDTLVYQIGKFDLTSSAPVEQRGLSDFFRLKSSENVPLIQKIIPAFLFIMFFLYLWKSSLLGCIQQNSAPLEIEKSNPPKNPDQNSQDKKPWVDI